MKYRIFLKGLVFISVLLAHPEICAQDRGRQYDTRVPEDQMPPFVDEYYPDTEDAPVLEFFFDAPIEGNITRITPYGVWEGPPSNRREEPANEMQFYTKTVHDAIYSPAKGIVVSVFRPQKRLTVRYGKNYGFTFHHIEDIPEDIKVGVKVEERTLLGYTQHDNNEGWWEIELDVKRGNQYRTLPPYDYFSPKSKAKLDLILEAVEREPGHYDSWVVRKGRDSWIAELGTDEWETSPERVGYE